MALPAFITADPSLSLSIASTLAKLGSGLLGRNAAKDAMTKAEEENRKIMARANLRQAFGGNPSVDLVQPKLDPGFGTTLLSRLGDAAALASQAYGLYDAKKLRDLQKRAAEQTIAAGDRAAGIAQGKANYAADIQRRADAARLLAPPAAGGTGPSLGQFPGFGGAPISQQPVSPFEALGRSQAAQEEADSTWARRLTEAQIESYEATGRAREVSAYADYLKEYKDLSTVDFKRIKDSVNLATPIVENAAATNRSWQEVTSSPLMADIDIRSSEVLKAVFENSRRDIAATQNKDLSDFLYGDLSRKFNSDQLIKKSGDLIFGMNLMANGFNRQNGVGDLMMVNAMVRLSDPGVSVRPMEALQM